MYNKYTSLEKNGIGELECMISQTQNLGKVAAIL